MRTGARWSVQPTSGSTAQANVGMHLTSPHFAESVPRELELIVTARINAMLYGPPAALDAAFSRLLPHLHAPLHRRSGGSDWSFAGLSAGTLVLEHAAACSRDQQQALMQWLDAANGAVQVITLTNQPLVALVKSGAFLAALYYRLNVMLLDLSGTA
jgi:Sigma-54 interaction domain